MNLWETKLSKINLNMISFQYQKKCFAGVCTKITKLGNK